jgi:hypothetical protein
LPAAEVHRLVAGNLGLPSPAPVPASGPLFQPAPPPQRPRTKSLQSLEEEERALEAELHRRNLERKLIALRAELASTPESQHHDATTADDTLPTRTPRRTVLLSPGTPAVTQRDSPAPNPSAMHYPAGSAQNPLEVSSETSSPVLFVAPTPTQPTATPTLVFSDSSATADLQAEVDQLEALSQARMRLKQRAQDLRAQLAADAVSPTQSPVLFIASTPTQQTPPASQSLDALAPDDLAKKIAEMEQALKTKELRARAARLQAQLAPAETSGSPGTADVGLAHNDSVRLALDLARCSPVFDSHAERDEGFGSIALADRLRLPRYLVVKSHIDTKNKCLAVLVRALDLERTWVSSTADSLATQLGGKWELLHCCALREALAAADAAVAPGSRIAHIRIVAEFLVAATPAQLESIVVARTMPLTNLLASRASARSTRQSENSTTSGSTHETRLFFESRSWCSQQRAGPFA